MSYKAAIIGAANTGKSYSRRTIRDGENVIILQPSVKMPHLFKSDKTQVQPFDIEGNKFKNLEEARIGLAQPTIHHVINIWNYKLSASSIKREAIRGNVVTVKDVANLPVWMKFIDKHMPWIHTVIIADFSHFISEIISRPEFINRKAGGDAYTKFWELAGEALRNFILDLDNYRSDMIVVTEYHAAYDPILGVWEMYTPAGKMLIDKFKPETYYDVFLMTDVKVEEDLNGDIIKEEYSFITKRTKTFPLARAANLFEETRIPNDLQLVLDKIRTYLGIQLK